MRGDVGRELHAEPPGAPELDIEYRGIGRRQILAAEIVLAGERLVEHGKPLLDHLAAARLDRVLLLGGAEISRPEDAREALAVYGADGVFHRLIRPHFGFEVLRDQL